VWLVLQIVWIELAGVGILKGRSQGFVVGGGSVCLQYRSYGQYPILTVQCGIGGISGGCYV